jgi:sec-independent protein translocase protein TatC
MAQPNSFLTQLIELRSRLLYCIGFVAILFLICYPFANYLYDFLAHPLLRYLPNDKGQLIAIDVLSPFTVPLKLTIMCAIALAIPFIAWQLWRFIAPGLYTHERRMIAPIVMVSSLLFYSGILFAYFLVLPIIFQFIIYTTPSNVHLMTDISVYLDFVLTLFFAFGIAFQVPVVIVLALRMQLVSLVQLKQQRPYVIIGAFVIGMLLTPPDVFSQTLLAIPLCLLFEAGLLWGRFFESKGNSRVETETN